MLRPRRDPSPLPTLPLSRRTIYFHINIHTYVHVCKHVCGGCTGTLALFSLPFSWWRNADTFETLNIVFGWLITFSCLELYLERSPAHAPAKTKEQ